jgi:hypothetical protein
MNHALSGLEAGWPAEPVGRSGALHAAEIENNENTSTQAETRTEERNNMGMMAVKK